MFPSDLSRCLPFRSPGLEPLAKNGAAQVIVAKNRKILCSFPSDSWSRSGLNESEFWYRNESEFWYRNESESGIEMNQNLVSKRHLVAKGRNCKM